MDERIDAALRRCHDGLSRTVLLGAGIPRSVIDTEVRRGGIVRVFPNAYVRASAVDDPAARERAAAYSIDRAAVSHLSGLRRHGLLGRPPADVHLSVMPGRARRRQPGLVLHRAQPPPRWSRDGDGIAVVTPAEAIVQSWSLLPRGERRAPAIFAARQRLTTADELREATERRPRLRDRRELSDLVELLAQGCESELEIWGALRVFDVPGLRHATRQLAVRTPSGTFRLDLAYESELLDVELDGDRYHSTKAQRDYDRRRDNALATLGWQTLRFSYMRLTGDPDGCRHQTLAVLATRRRLLGLRPP